MVLFDEKLSKKWPNPAFLQQNRPKSDRLLAVILLPRSAPHSGGFANVSPN
jgi:hypothetical protein